MQTKPSFEADLVREAEETFESWKYPTSKMSHDASRRDSCASTRRDGWWRWLWRLVRPMSEVGPDLEIEKRCAVTARSISSHRGSRVRLRHDDGKPRWTHDQLRGQTTKSPARAKTKNHTLPQNVIREAGGFYLSAEAAAKLCGSEELTARVTISKAR